MGSNSRRIIPLLGIAHLVEGKLFQVPKAHMGMGRIQVLRDEEMAIYGLVMYFVKIKNLGKRPGFRIIVN